MIQPDGCLKDLVLGQCKSRKRHLTGTGSLSLDFDGKVRFCHGPKYALKTEISVKYAGNVGSVKCRQEGRKSGGKGIPNSTNF